MTQDSSFARDVTELTPHSDLVTEAVWSPSGNYICSIGRDKKVIIHDVQSQVAIHTFPSKFPLMHAAFIDDHTLLLCDFSTNLQTYDWRTGKLKHSLKLNAERAYAMRFCEATSTIAVGYQSGEIELATIANGKIQPHPRILNMPGSIWQIEWATTGNKLYASSTRSGITIFDTKNMSQLETFPGNGPFAVLDGKNLLAAFQRDFSIRIFDLNGRRIALLEGNTEKIGKITFTSDGRFLISKSIIGKCIAWETDNWRLVAEWNETVIYPRFPLACSPIDSSKILTTGAMQKSAIVRTLKDDSIDPQLFGNPQYKNAKIVLMGDSGVGKSALAHQLLGHGWRFTDSTHSRQIDRLLREIDGEELREVYLWDLAGQPNYRLTHQLHLDEVSTAIVMFDDKAERDPFTTPRYWERALSTAAINSVSGNAGPKKILVAGRIDRGDPFVSRESIESFTKEYGFSDYLRTSAKTGVGIDELREAAIQSIDWEKLPSISSTALFQEVQELILQLKTSGKVILPIQDSYIELIALAKNKPSQMEFRTCVALLESRGLVRRLPTNDSILFSPEYLDAYASAIVNEARSDPKGLGTVKESDILNARLSLPTTDRIPNPEIERFLIIATLEDLIIRQLAYRENTSDGTVIVFPSQFLHEKPDLSPPEDIVLRIRFRGPLQNIFSILTVRLFYSQTVLSLKEIWKNGIVLRDAQNRRAGIQISDHADGQGEIAIFFEDGISNSIKIAFTDFIQHNIFQQAQPGSVKLSSVARCANPSCRTDFTNDQIEKRKQRGFTSIICNVCDTSNPIPRLDGSTPNPQLRSTAEAIDAAQLTTEHEAQLSVGVGLIETRELQTWLTYGVKEPHIVVVFTDIVNSTAIANDIGDIEMEKIKEIHFNKIGNFVTRHQGKLIKNTGDGVLAVFKSTIRAAQFSIDAAADTGHKLIKIRIGLHAGRVAAKGDDISGTTVNYASRIQNHIKLGGIAVSQAAKDEIKRLLGRHESEYMKWSLDEGVVLRGFEGKHTIWRLTNYDKRFPTMTFD